MNLLQDILSVFLPKRCLACGSILVEGEDKLCLGCRELLETNKISDYNQSQIRMRLPLDCNVLATVSVFYYSNNSLSANLICKFKYGKDVTLGSWLCGMLCDELNKTEWIHTIDYVIPMPLHPLRQLQRGFNQSEVLARCLCERFPNITLNKSIKRIRYRRHQVKSGKNKRYTNVKGVFALKHKDMFCGKSVLLVDDVITTGASLSGCVKILNQCKDIKIYVATIAATQH